MLFIYLSIIETEEDKTKFENLYLKYYRLMHYVSAKILPNDAAEDAVHSAFISIINHLDKIENVNSHKTKGFVIVVVENLSKQIYNKSKKHRNFFIDDLDNEISDDYRVEDNYMNKVSKEEIVSVIGQLSEIYRDVLMLKYFHDCRDKEIGSILGIKAATVRKRLERARHKLLTLLSQDKEGEIKCMVK